MLVAFFRYSRDQAFAVLGQNRVFVTAMVAATVAGSVVGGLGVVPEAILVPLLAALPAVLRGQVVAPHLSPDGVWRDTVLHERRSEIN